MFENAKWIALENGKIAPWKGTIIPDEDHPEWENHPDFINREKGSVLFRREFNLDEKPQAAALAVCGLGFYDVYINGQLADPKRVLAPVISNYFKYAKYDVYDVTSLLNEGKNVIAAEVSGGWFTAHKKFWGWRQMFHGNPRLIAELKITDFSGKTVTVVTDTVNWKAAHGAVTESCVYDGEKIDLNLVQKGWNHIDFDGKEWANAVEAEAPTDKLIECVAPPIRIAETVEAVNARKLSETETVYDFGTNTSGLPELVVKGKKGDTVTLNFSEYIFPDGTLDEASCQCGGADNTDIFILTGEDDICSPRFTWHGYRYCRVTLSNPEIKLEKIVKNVIHSDVEITGEFECSDKEINRLHEAYVRTQINCLLGIPVDCNQRGERLGWMGDVAVTAEECVNNFDMRAFYASYLDDMRKDRNPSKNTIGFIAPSTHRYDDGTSIDWNMAYPIVLNECCKRYGDKALSEEHYETLKAHTQYYISHSKNGLLNVFVPRLAGGETAACWFGDWFTLDFPNGTEKVAFEVGTDDHRQNPPFLGSVFYVWLLELCEKIATDLDKTQDAKEYAKLRNEAVNALREKYYDSEKHIFGSGGQFLLTIALYLHIVPEADRKAVFNNLLKELEKENYHSIMGIYGLRLLPEVLNDFGRNDIWFKLLTVTDYPSPLYMISKGQTTISEELAGGGSGCHPMFASPDATLYKVFGGIQIDRRESIFITIKPYCPQEWDFVRSSQKIAEGEVKSSWEREGDKITFNFTVPENCKANVYLENGENTISNVYAAGTHTVTL